MNALTIELPDSAVEFVRQQASARGFKSPEDFLATLVTDAQKRLEDALIQGLDSRPSRPMNAADWDQLKQNVHSRSARPTR
jgi:hypothetical protein